jgi:MoxR-like ATPase
MIPTGHHPDCPTAAAAGSTFLERSECPMNPEPPVAIAADRTVFHGDNGSHPIPADFPLAPPWRRFDEQSRSDRGAKHRASVEEIVAVNAAMYLRRPLLVTGRPGTGKTSLAYAVREELELDEVLLWPITSRTTLQQGLYQYDAIARLQDASLVQSAASARPADAPPAAETPAPLPGIGRYLQLGPLGAALATSRPGRPRVLLIDEIDKSDIDLPNDLLHIFEEGEFDIPELARLPDDAEHNIIEVGLAKGGTVRIERGRVHCSEFPIVFLTSNGERDFPPAFLRRCLRLDIPQPDDKRLAEIVRERLGVDTEKNPAVKKLIADFVADRDQRRQQLATDQLLNAVRLVTIGLIGAGHRDLKQYVLRDLSDAAG